MKDSASLVHINLLLWFIETLDTYNNYYINTTIPSNYRMASYCICDAFPLFHLQRHVILRKLKINWKFLSIHFSSFYVYLTVYVLALDVSITIL